MFRSVRRLLLAILHLVLWLDVANIWLRSLPAYRTLGGDAYSSVNRVAGLFLSGQQCLREVTRLQATYETGARRAEQFGYQLALRE